MEVLRIEWHRTFDEHDEGYMELILDKFFPCTIEKANKIFKLVGRWCSDETIAELENYFAEKIEIIEKQIAEIKHIYPSTSVGSYEKKKCETDFKQLQTVMKKYNRMVKLLHIHTQMKGSD
jgi:hypothetical protein